jgi:photosystem II stability/assembly factor-like uncharacterized protein
MHKLSLFCVAFLFLFTTVPSQAQDPEASAGEMDGVDNENVVYDPSLYESMEYRMIGPYRGGRVTAVDGYPERPQTFLMGGVGGGVWKTTNAGESWNNITDGDLNVGPIGAISVAPSDRSVIYVGTGSAEVRGNISVGDGVYRSTDGGRTWVHMGLPESHHIRRIQVHPRDADVVYVTALGHIFGPNEERGVYRSTDGGETWERVLHVSERTGAIDLRMHPENPRILYAAMWQAERKPWAMHSGPHNGPNEGGVWKTRDGGDSWSQLTNGLPTDSVGKIGLAVSGANPDQVYALVEARENNRGLYRSDDGGESFELVSDFRGLLARAWYYTHVDAHPTKEDVVYVSSEDFFRSEDGGESFEEVNTPHGDNHDLWINPKRPEIAIQANDGGANVTVDGMVSWSTQLNQPTAEFYSLEVDDQFPYRVYAPQQDNSTISIPSRFTNGITPYENWFATAGCETGPLAVDPEDPNIIYGGCKGRISQHNRKTDQVRQLWVYPLEYHGRSNQELKYRRQWTSQIEFSPHDPDRLYHPSQHVHVTRDEGQTWQTISPDLTNWDQHKDLHQTPPGGPLTYDNTGVEIYGTIHAFEESPHTEGVLWAGSDDGRVSLSRDGGDTWTEVTPEGVELHSTVADLTVSPHEPGRAFIAVHRYRMDDWRPMIYRTDNYGEDWTLLTDGTNGIPAEHPTRTIAEDPDRQGLLYAGTEFGLFVSFDDGEHWQSFQQNLPETPITDLLVHEQDLIVATQGRSLWIMDDLTPLHQITDEVAERRAYLYEPRSTYRMRLQDPGWGAMEGPRGGENPPDGAMIHYYLDEQPDEEVTLEIRDPEGSVVQEFTSATEEEPSLPDSLKPGMSRLERQDISYAATPQPHLERNEEEVLPAEAGMNRFVWDLQYPGAFLADGVHVESPAGGRVRVSVITGYTGGPYAVPGTYEVTLTVGGESQTRSFEVLKDPRLETTQSELEELLDFSLEVRDKISQVQRNIAAIHKVQGELLMLQQRKAVKGTGLVNRAQEVIEELDEVASELYKHRKSGDHAHLHPELTTSYARIYTMLISSDHRPPNSARERFEDLRPEFNRHVDRLEEVLKSEVRALNKTLQGQGISPISVPSVAR